MVNISLKSLGLEAVRGEEAYVERVKDMPICKKDYKDLSEFGKYVGVTDQFKDVINTFQVADGETPAGFKRELVLEKDGVIKVDLVRDISYDKNGILRPTNVLFSADSANPYEVGPISPLLANLTCNPGIVYDLFINNPEANVGNVYKNRDE
ncbi:MAG: transaldolase, partial [Lachnospiraceae bacterium]|nr:transaldolase [Lachnospiraceae bacterium]